MSYKKSAALVHHTAINNNYPNPVSTSAGSLVQINTQSFALQAVHIVCYLIRMGQGKGRDGNKNGHHGHNGHDQNNVQYSQNNGGRGKQQNNIRNSNNGQSGYNDHNGKKNNRGQYYNNNHGIPQGKSYQKANGNYKGNAPAGQWQNRNQNQNPNNNIKNNHHGQPFFHGVDTAHVLYRMYVDHFKFNPLHAWQRVQDDHNNMFLAGRRELLVSWQDRIDADGDVLMIEDADVMEDVLYS
jgi:hypothetical protein